MTSVPALAVLRLLSVNPLDLYAGDRPVDRARYAGLEELIRRLDPDILAVQEIIADGATHAKKRAPAARGLRRLAAAVGLECEVGGEPAVAVGGIAHHTGLLWRAGLTPVPGSLHQLDRRVQMWHCAISVVFAFGGLQVRVGSVQLSPFSGVSREADAGQLLRVFHDTDLPGFIGGDFNGLSADEVYDPDPYPSVPWHPHHVHQLGLVSALT